MKDYTNRVVDDAIRMGLRNRETIELARRHCLDLEFVATGGHGMVEAQTGLPVDMRQIRCPVAHGDMASNLELLVEEFYRANCVGCGVRRPTGEVPNLATRIDDADQAAAAARTAEQAAAARLSARRQTRAEQRRALGAALGEAMAGALDDLDLVDADPSAPADAQATEGALGRLAALADRAPELFDERVVDAAAGLVRDGLCPELLDPLRRLAVRRGEFARRTVEAALTALRAGPAPWAGPVLAELTRELADQDVDDAIVRSLVWLAGAPALDELGRSRPGRANDPTGLRAVAVVAPDRVAKVLDAMLPPAAVASALELPAGAAPAPGPVPTRHRAAAADAVRALAGTSPELAAGRVHALVRDLAVPPDDPYDDPAAPAVERALAALLVDGVGDVLEALAAAAPSASRAHRERLVRVIAVAADMVSSDPKGREQGDPDANGARRRAVSDALVAAAAGPLAGDWGDDARFGAAGVLETLANDDPAAMLPRVPVLLGAVLGLLGDRDVPVRPSLDVLAGQRPAEDFFDRMNRQSAVDGAIRQVLDAVEAAAAAGPAEAARLLAELLADDRDAERSSGLPWRLIPLLGRIGRRHGHQPGVLQRVLPVLHSHMLGDDAALRAAAIDAWCDVATAHAVPSSLSDLLPALSNDRLVIVSRAVARAAVRLDWSEEDQWALLRHAMELLHGVDPATSADALKDAARAALSLASALDANGLRRTVEAALLAVASGLNGRDLRDVLDRAWLPESARSPEMARLRLAQAVDERVNDRWNARDGDRELVALLACGPGLAGLSDDDLARAAAGHAPEHPLAAAEYAEVAWRAGRPAAAAAAMARCLDATPDQPAYAGRRDLLELVRASAQADADAAAGEDWRPAAAAASAAARAATADGRTDERSRLARFAAAAADVRALLASALAGRTGRDPAVSGRERADGLEAAGRALDAASQTATDTGGYLRAVAESCAVAAHVVRADAAELDADVASTEAHLRAAARRAETVLGALDGRFAADDPLTAPLRALLTAVAAEPRALPATGALAGWHALPLPVPVVAGPRRAAAGLRGAEPSSPPAPAPVAVLLASLDGRLVTGPEVLRHGRVYDLRVEVRTDPWPDWADRLELDFVTHLTPAEITVPTFTWGRADHAGDGETYIKSGTLILRFGVASGQNAPPLRPRLLWRGTRDGEPAWQAVDVSGHRELRLRPYDATRDKATEYPVFDERLLGLYDSLARAGYDDDQLQAFCRLLTSVCRAGLRMTWDKQYRRGRRVTEREFHDDLHDELVADPDLGGRVERGRPLALGFLDTRHDGITAELKVERRTPVTRETARKYMTQPTQYAAADGARLSILAILDMSKKELTVGAPENYLFTLEPRLHGLDGPDAPSLVAVLIVNGNMPPPSSWSGRAPAEPPVMGD